MGDLVSTYLESGSTPYSYLVDRIQREEPRQSIAEQLLTEQKLRIAKALRKIELADTLESVRRDVFGGPDVKERKLDQMGEYFLDRVKRFEVNRILKEKRNWFERSSPEITREILETDPDLIASGYQSVALEDYDDSVKEYGAYIARSAKLLNGEQIQPSPMKPSQLLKADLVRERLSPWRVNRMETSFAAIEHLFGYGVMSLDNPVAIELVDEYGPMIIEYLHESNFAEEKDLWVPNKHYLRAKEVFGPDRFKQIQERFFTLKSVLKAKKEMSKGDFENGQFPDEIKVKSEEVEMLLAMARAVRLILEADKNGVSTKDIDQDLAGKLYEQILMNYQPTIGQVQDHKRQQFLGTTVYDDLLKGKIPGIVS